MNSIRTEQIAFDANVFIFASLQPLKFPACRELLFEKLTHLKIHIPVQVLIELNQNLSNHQISIVFRALRAARSLYVDYSIVDHMLINKWKVKGAKKGDAIITAHLEMAGISYLISENRHFLSEISGLPFKVLSSQQAIAMLDG